ncbi:uncharacterized protein F4822DRAFT_427405 [Hypoxylon trugodes]|uniref:uncharacterized protein n=1 Tax=Hypoxylon trugodes TaxID=326681 RepID=UPI00219C5F54|nr:uncharacterized protein F4822DRAFT_427405 [Hypoxylon trugodes]KAI1391554.1 hypothetical protein F4822DRAFT_427405 [Hypoxylon trugodes]
MHFSLKFLKELPLYEEVQPYKLYGFDDVSEEDQTNCVFEIVQEVQVYDVRGAVVDPSIDREGFEFVISPTNCALSAEVFEGDDTRTNGVVDSYIRETMDLVKTKLDAESVVAIDWRFRRSANATAEKLDVGDIRKQAIAVATTAHCDFSYLGGFERIKMHLAEDEMAAIERGELKAMIVNVWRPLKTVRSAPLIMADRRTVSKKDLIEADQVMVDKVTRTAYVYHRPDQRWYWLKNQRADEIIMFPTWKAETNIEHAAAFLYQSDSSESPRESVEVRMIVLSRA